LFVLKDMVVQEERGSGLSGLRPQGIAGDDRGQRRRTVIFQTQVPLSAVTHIHAFHLHKNFVLTTTTY
jgi:hypothetical protein